MSSQVVLETDEYTFTKLTLKDRCSPGCRPVASLVLAALGPTAVAALAVAHPAKLVQDLLAIAHEARRLPHRLAVLRLLAKLTLVSSDPRNSLVSRYFKNTKLTP